MVLDNFKGRCNCEILGEKEINKCIEVEDLKLT